jgi:hypothetical protein
MGMAFALLDTSSIQGAQAMTKALKIHDHVRWNTPQGETTGHITRVITSHTKLDGHEVAASKDEPHYEVESDKSGKRAVHKGDSLKRVSH